jgi:imidazole glycerol-phosphate synthase subunit HisH
MITIIDYGAGNLRSVKKAFDHLGAEVVVTDNAETIASADKIVLPGVGHFSSLRVLDQTGVRQILLQAVSAGKPFLGICLGMQWLFEGSEESEGSKGAGIFLGECQRFPSSVKSPHVGWNSLEVQTDSLLLRGIVQSGFVYYTHSFHAPVVAGTTAASEYGLQFSAAVEKDNLFGVQFHPEKSGDLGLSILKNFCEI